MLVPPKYFAKKLGKSPPESNTTRHKKILENRAILIYMFSEQQMALRCCYTFIIPFDEDTQTMYASHLYTHCTSHQTEQKSQITNTPNLLIQYLS